VVFNSFHFVVFFLLVYAAYRVLPHRQQNWLLLISSYYFYGSWDWRFLGLLLASTVIDFFCGLYIASRPNPRQRKIALLVSLGFNLSMLGFFKYFNFFAGNFQAVLQTLGFRADYVTLQIVLPIGISFYTFITMSYVIDVYRDHIKPCRNLLDFALFICYFPHLVAGPILRAELLLPQITCPRKIRREQIEEGLWLILWGFFKKVFVADNLAKIADAVFAQSGHLSQFYVLTGLYAFAFQIYGDFSGYSDIARGTSLLMGIELNVNFRFPYFVRSPSAFWRNWHISLSTWLRDYLYIPLGGNRGSTWFTKRNLLLTMLLGGLWHGAAWTYIIWGLYQGLLLVAFHPIQNRLKGRPWLEAPLERFAAVVIMFHLTCYGWLIFRARSVAQIGSFTSALLFGGGAPSPPVVKSYLFQLVFYTAVLLAIHVYEASRNDLKAVLKLPGFVRYPVYVLLFYMTVLWGDFGGSQFIYFQF
jgi:alginate O-acetyltransferase complex protein AlgI